MTRFLPILVLFGFSNAIIAPPTAEIDDAVEIFNDWKDTREEFMDAMQHPMGLPHFNCPQVTTEPPVSVHQLHPSNIDVIAALGDSVSVAQAARSSSFSDLLQKYPGVSFVTGDDVALKDQATLFNMFRQFSPQIRGGSSDHIQRFYDFNFAVAGSFSFDLPDQAIRMAGTFERRLKRENLKTWKFVNLFIGHNDFCKYCTNQTLYGPETFGKSIRAALAIIREKVPNVFVNIMPPINVQIHSQAHNVSKFCEVSHRTTCPCIFEMSEDQYFQLKNSFDQELKKIVEEFNFPSSSNFTVVLSPAMDLKSIPLLDTQPNVGLLALDCFHLSPIAHDIAAKQVWKGLFEKVGQKTVTSQLSRGFDRFVCPPVECPYLRTSENSEQCVPPKLLDLKLLQIPNAGIIGTEEANVPAVMLIGFFIAGTVMILLFLRPFFRSSSSSISDERHHLLLPMRRDLNDNIF